MDDSDKITLAMAKTTLLEAANDALIAENERLRADNAKLRAEHDALIATLETKSVIAKADTDAIKAAEVIVDEVVNP